MIDMGDVIFLVILLVLVAMLVHGMLTAKRRRIEDMDDHDPFDDAEWKFGTPDDPVPEDAKPFDAEKD